MTADYLRAQARTCTQWARECFDLGTTARLRAMANEFHVPLDSEAQALEESPTPADIADILDSNDDKTK